MESRQGKARAERRWGHRGRITRGPFSFSPSNGLDHFEQVIWVNATRQHWGSSVIRYIRETVGHLPVTSR